MSIATESISPYSIQMIENAEIDARKIAKEHGVKVRKNPYCGIDVKFSDGKKVHYFGWMQLRADLVRSFDLAE